jgi:hypothetical protein
VISHEQVACIRHLFHAEHWRVGTIASELGFHAEIAGPVDVIVWIYGKQDDHGEVALRAGPLFFLQWWTVGIKGALNLKRELFSFLTAIDGPGLQMGIPGFRPSAKKE